MPDTPILDDGSPEGHTEKMLAMGKPKEEPKVDPVVDDSTTVRPDNIPEKFWDSKKGELNTEALLKAQADGEAALRQNQNETDEDKATRIAAEAEAAKAEASSQTNVVASASAQFVEKGELSAETYEALNTVGLSNDMVNSYIQGQKAIVASLQDAAYTPFEGKKDGYEQAANWAAESFTDSEIKALDVQLTSNNPAIVAQGAKALQARFAAESDIEPLTIRGDGNTNATGDSYKSSREMMKDMNSRQYRTSAAFRANVAAKMGRSNL